MEPRIGQSLPSVRRSITQGDVERYAQASGDFNPIHVDQEFARASQFGGTIAHGMMVAASLSEVMSRAFGLPWARSGRLKIHFRSPVRPGDTYEATGQVKAVKPVEAGLEVTCALEVRILEGETAITGEAKVTLPQRQEDP